MQGCKLKEKVRPKRVPAESVKSLWEEVRKSMEVRKVTVTDEGYDFDMEEEKYTVDQIVEAIVQADEHIIQAMLYHYRDGLEDVLKDFLH